MSDEVLALFELPASTLEKIGCQVTSEVDPTSVAPRFTVTVDADDQPTGWVNGSWDGSWVAGTVKAKSPTVGLTGGLVVAPGDFHLLFIQWDMGTQKPVRRVCYLSFT